MMSDDIITKGKAAIEKLLKSGYGKFLQEQAQQQAQSEATTADNLSGD